MRVIATERIPEQHAGQTREPRLPVIALPQARRRSQLVALDWFERLLLLAFFGWLVARMLAHYLAYRQAANLVLLPSEGLVVVLVLIRRPASQLSRSLADWLMALVVTCSFMLVAPVADASLVPAALGVLLVLMGTVIQVHAKVVLGRSFGCVPAHRGLKLRGPYQMVRHPMYAGYLVSHLAFLAMNPTWWNAAIYAFCYGLQIPRLLAEERLLARDPAYRSYQATVRYRLVPRVF